MADLKNFNDDEQLILMLICNCDALCSKILELTNWDIDCIELSLSLSAVGYLNKITDDEAKQLLAMHRERQMAARESANKHSQYKNN